MKKGESLAAAFLKKHGFAVTKIPSSRRGVKTPDFELHRDGGLVGYAEVKTHEKARSVRGSDPTYNRVSKHIDEALKQFQSVNPRRTVPNILIIVNDNWTSDYQDLKAVLDGFLPCEGGGTFRGFMKYAQGRIRTRKFDIGLFVWLDLHSRDHMVFNQLDKKHFDKLCGWFSVDPREITAT